ncbi:MAG TPA: polymer-forming cytoskeletal protein [Thermomicrobiales bacterium]|jgi:cytoskeletal protein CcmA (bactofilin family)|nr:polymer-forming cytoskeletal protein [Thermomicrobiales bacterium]
MSLRAQDAPAATDTFGVSESASVIDRHSEFDGTYSTDRDLRIEGRARGKLSCQGTLHVAQGATVNAEIEAEQVVVAGVLEGTVTCRTRLQIMPSGDLKGRISTPSLVINEGARYEGQMEMPTQNTRLSSARTRPSLAGGATSDDQDDRQGVDTSAGRPAGGGFIRRFGTPEARDMPESDRANETDDVVNES